MSVINQMLRDLDQRGQGLEGAVAAPGIRSVEAAPAAPNRRTHGRSRWAVFLGALLLLSAIGGAWYGGFLAPLGWSTPERSLPSSAAPSAAQAPAVATAASAAMPFAEPVEQAPVTVVDIPSVAAPSPGAPMALRLDAALEHLPRLSAPPRSVVAASGPGPGKAGVIATTQPPVAAPVPVLAAPPASAPVAERAPVPATPAPANVVSVDTTSGPARQLAAARDALAQAQTLWGQGNQNGAQDLLRDALQSADRNSAVVGMDAVLVAMVRELARMQLALGRVSEAHEMLVAHEGRTRQVAEIWALRANAAQRLGQHADSVHAYMQALQSRPTEQRWLLGLAVSLAAMGQTQAASEVVERARSEGPIAREIANYLRQMGVTVR